MPGKTKVFGKRKGITVDLIGDTHIADGKPKKLPTSLCRGQYEGDMFMCGDLLKMPKRGNEFERAIEDYSAIVSYNKSGKKN